MVMLPIFLTLTINRRLHQIKQEPLVMFGCSAFWYFRKWTLFMQPLVDRGATMKVRKSDHSSDKR